MATDGGPAFPSWDYVTQGDAGGMTLRDYFAAKAMAAIIAIEGPDKKHHGVYNANQVASDAYAIARAMLEARDE